MGSHEGLESVSGEQNHPPRRIADLEEEAEKRNNRIMENGKKSGTIERCPFSFIEEFYRDRE
jgi:hypothetical protein